MTQVHQYCKVDFASVSLCFQDNVLFVYTLSSWQAWTVSSFFHSCSAATFASGIPTACCIHRNTLVCQIVMFHWVIPFAMWSSWSFNRDSSIRGLVDPWDSTLQAYCFFGKLLDASSLATASCKHVRLFVFFLERKGRFHMLLQLSPRIHSSSGCGRGCVHVCVHCVLAVFFVKGDPHASQVTRGECPLNPLTWHSAENGARKRARHAGMTCTHKRWDVLHKYKGGMEVTESEVAKPQIKTNVRKPRVVFLSKQQDQRCRRKWRSHAAAMPDPFTKKP